MLGESITGLQIRAARAALNLSVRELAEQTGIGHATIVRYEAIDGIPTARKGNLQTLKAAFEAAGIEFIETTSDAPGIRIHPTQRPGK